MFIYIFLSIALHEGGKFIINTAKRCFFRLIELQPVECLFSIHGGKFFPSSSHLLHVVFESVPLSVGFLDLPFSSNFAWPIFY